MQKRKVCILVMNAVGKGLYYAQKALAGGHCTLFGTTQKGLQIFRHGDYPEYIFVKDGIPVKRIIQDPSQRRFIVTRVDDFANDEFCAYVSDGGAVEKDISLAGVNINMSPKTGAISMIGKSKDVSQFIPYEDRTKIDAFIATFNPQIKSRLNNLYENFINMLGVHGVK